MYNGIGLLTARGSGTSGYVSTNKFNLRGPPRTGGGPVALDAEGPKQKKANQDIIEHNRKREIEAKVFELQDQLEEDGCSPPPLTPLFRCLHTRSWHALSRCAVTELAGWEMRRLRRKSPSCALAWRPRRGRPARKQSEQADTSMAPWAGLKSSPGPA